MNNRHFLGSIFLLNFLKKWLNSRSTKVFFEKKITEKDKLKSVDCLCLPTEYLYHVGEVEINNF
ncbi:MAG: hypothetical protein ACJAUH_000396 [Saprospiraceae bacterium]|jgi:hypothetical protein